MFKEILPTLKHMNKGKIYTTS